MMLTIGSDYVNNQKFDKAVEIFSDVIDLDPVGQKRGIKEQLSIIW